MKYSVIISKSAFRQLSSIIEWIAIHSSSSFTAMKWASKFEKAILSLEEFPYRYPFLKQEHWLSKGIRKMPISPYIAFYLIRETEMKVHLNAFCHGLQSRTGPLKKAFGL
jgi:toxin ParE1/3/4